MQRQSCGEVSQSPQAISFLFRLYTDCVWWLCHRIVIEFNIKDSESRAGRREESKEICQIYAWSEENLGLNSSK